MPSIQYSSKGSSAEAKSPVVRAALVAVSAVRNYVEHQSANQAGSVAFSFLISMFPLLILLASAAGFIGHPGDAAALAGRLLSYAPSAARDALRPAIDQVLGHRDQSLLAAGLIATIWTASSGIQAIRTALNRAYGVERGLPFWQARIKVTLFTVVVGAGTIVAFGSVVVMPYVWKFLQQDIGVDIHSGRVQDIVRYGSAFLVLSTLYALLYGWLPDVPQKLRTVLPGALCGASLWIAAAAVLSLSLRSAGKLVLIYGGFAGVVATLVFLYLSAASLLIGAEINGVLRGQGPGAGSKVEDC